jgi:hypothetical protein
MTWLGRSIRLLGLCLAALACLGYGFLVSEIGAPPRWAGAAYEWSRQFAPLRKVYHALRVRPADSYPRLGLWRKAPEGSGAGALEPEQREAIGRLEAIGYLAGYEAAGQATNVTLHLPEFAWPGVNLITSGHAPEALLTDMDGRVLHRWSYGFQDAFPELARGELESGMGYWRRAQLLENGDLLAIYEGHGLIRLDRHSNLIWANACRCHHDLYVDEAGLIYSLSRKAQVVPRIHAFDPVLLDFLVVLSPEGEELRRIAILEAFEQSSYASMLAQAPPSGDLFHTNTVEILDGRFADRSPAFRAGNALLSMREMDTIAILDPDAERIVWALSGQWSGQHQPTFLANGNLLLLDNRGHRGMSKVIELDPLTQQIAWVYEGTPANGFSTRTGGSNQALPNGNVLITESDSGRAIEVTRDGRVVWEYYNPARAGDHLELIATLCEVVRLDPALVAGWLGAGDSGPGRASDAAPAVSE